MNVRFWPKADIPANALKRTVSFVPESDEALAMLHEALERLSVKIESTDRLQSPDQASPIQTSIPRTWLRSRRALHSHRYASIPTPSSNPKKSIEISRR